MQNLVAGPLGLQQACVFDPHPLGQHVDVSCFLCFMGYMKPETTPVLPIQSWWRLLSGGRFHSEDILAMNMHGDLRLSAHPQEY